MPRRTLTLAALLACSAAAFAQPTAPVTVDSHTRAHNPPHEKVLDEGRFHTSREGAPIYLPAEEDAYTFVVFGDRTGGPNEGIDVLTQAVADTNLLEPDLVMTVGDLINGYNTTPEWTEQMVQYKDVMGHLLCPWFPVAGNHDIYWRGPDKPEGEHEQSYETHFGPLWYAFEHKNSWFIVLYSDESDPETGIKDFNRPDSQRMSPEQYDWLKDTLATVTNDAEHVFLFLHHPRWIGGHYGDDWERVHQLLVEAGNVSAVFAGHIHRMRYDPRDGIEYVALATVGGGQSGLSPAAGYLHHYNLVTVRKDQIAMSSIPVGQIMDVREITGEVSTAAEKLAGMKPSLLFWPEVSDRGAVEGDLQVHLTNPTDHAVDIELTPESSDSRWTITPDHEHGQLKPGEFRKYTFKVSRAEAQLDEFVRPVTLTLAADLLTDHARFPVNPVEVTVPGTLILPEPKKPSVEHVLSLDGKTGGALIEAQDHRFPAGPFTVEAWVKPEAFSGRDGIVDAGEFGLHLIDGRPTLAVRVSNQWFEASTPEGSTLPLGEWTHLAGVFDGLETRLFVNGEPITRTKSVGPRREITDPLAIGADTWDNALHNTFHGNLDEIRLSDTARYDSPFTPERRVKSDKDTSVLLHMDAAIGPFLFESSTNAAHAKSGGSAKVIPAP